MKSDNVHERLVRREEIKGSSDRGFGLVFTTVFTIIGLWPMIFGDGRVRVWALAVAVGFLAASLVRPGLLAPLNRLWFKFVNVIGFHPSLRSEWIDPHLDHVSRLENTIDETIVHTAVGGREVFHSLFPPTKYYRALPDNGAARLAWPRGHAAIHPGFRWFVDRRLPLRALGIDFSVP